MYLTKPVLSLLLAGCMVILLLTVGPLDVTTAAVFGETYEVRSGDTLFGIAREYELTVDDIQRANGLDSDRIEDGSKLAIPLVETGGIVVEEELKFHRVGKGDSLYRISQKYDLSITELKTANSYTSDLILDGQVLFIPEPRTFEPPYKTYGLTAEEFDILVRTIYSEARGEPYVGQVAVGAVVLNRLRSPEFPNTIRGVVFQPRAFAPVADGQFWLTPNETARRAALDALGGWDPSGGALYFYNPDTATSRWIFTRSVIKRIGRHLFAI